MNNNMKIKLYSFIKHNGLIMIVSGTILFVVSIKASILGNVKPELIDWTIFFSIVATILLEWCTGILKNILLNRLEDQVKLENDYKKIIFKYRKENFIKYDNSEAAHCNLQILSKKNENKMVVTFPTVYEHSLQGKKIVICDSPDMYSLPAIIDEHFQDIFSAHDASHVYNQLHIRVNDWVIKPDSIFQITTSRTTYYSSLVTNRAMDYQWNKLSVRELLEYGPFLHSLKESQLSNHLGFNGFIESSDGYIPFIKRSRNLSIGKSTYGCSVEASLKVQYALNAEKQLTTDGIIQAIQYEIMDELHIPSSALEKFHCEKNMIAAYRDVVEGGKPQLLFYMRSIWTKKQVEEHFKSTSKPKKNSAREVKLLQDGNRILWIARNELKECALMPDCLIYKGKKYKMVPSTSASIVMLIKYLNQT